MQKLVFNGWVNGVEYNDFDEFEKAYKDALNAGGEFSVSSTSKYVDVPDKKAVVDFDPAHLIELAKESDCRVVDVVDGLYDALEDVAESDKKAVLEKAKEGLKLVADRKQFCKSELVEIKNQIAALEGATHDTQTELSNLDFVGGFFENIIDDHTPTKKQVPDWLKDLYTDDFKTTLSELEGGLTKMISDLFGK